MPEAEAGRVSLRWVGGPGAKGIGVVFLHGAGGNHSHWARQLQYLRRLGWGAVALDLPGHGRSPGEAQASVSAYAEAVVPTFASLFQAGFPRSVVVAGHSLGGAIALELALLHPPWLAGLCLVSSGAELPVPSEVLERLSRGERDDVVWRRAYGPCAPESLLRKAREEYASVPVEVLYRDFSACQRFDRRRDAGQVAVPTLVVCGAEDALTPPAGSRYLAEKTRGRLLIVPRAGHMVMLERPEAVSEALADFLLSLAGPACGGRG